MFLDSIKTAIRSIFKVPALERWLVTQTLGKTYDSFWVKLIPFNNHYSPNTIREVERDGIRYRLDISDYMEYTLYFGIQTEPRNQLYSLIQDSMVVFDIGTNIGETLLNFAKRNPTGTNYGFEPVPYLYERASYNISINPFKSIKLHNLALSNTKETLYFSLPNNHNSGGISMSKQKNSDMKEVQAIPLDDFVTENQITKVDFIKIDVEGFELNVLLGAKQTLLSQKPKLFIELSNSNLLRQNHSSKQLVEFLTDLGYTIQHAETNQPITAAFPFENTHFDIYCY
ncbi:MAG: FkbM family methyltransferase [Bacteroidia bacterium]|nr:FkbM family methyltransferase [Bacteroidia bacterium]